MTVIRVTAAVTTDVVVPEEAVTVGELANDDLIAEAFADELGLPPTAEYVVESWSFT